MDKPCGEINFMVLALERSVKRKSLFIIEDEVWYCFGASFPGFCKYKSHMIFGANIFDCQQKAQLPEVSASTHISLYM